MERNFVPENNCLIVSKSKLEDSQLIVTADFPMQARRLGQNHTDSAGVAAAMHDPEVAEHNDIFAGFELFLCFQRVLMSCPCLSWD